MFNSQEITNLIALIGKAQITGADSVIVAQLLTKLESLRTPAPAAEVVTNEKQE